MFHKNLTLPRGVESIWGEKNQQTQKSNQPLPPPPPSVTSNFYETLHVRSAGKYLQVVWRFYDIYCQSENMADFHILQGKLEPHFKYYCVVFNTIPK